MSLGVSFHIISSGDLEKVVQTSKVEQKPVSKRFLIFNRKSLETIDRFWDSLNESALKQEEFEQSGDAFLSLDMLLNERDIDFLEHEEPRESEQLRENRGMTVSVFSFRGAKSAKEQLAATVLSASEVGKFLQEEGLPEAEISKCTEAVLKAFSVFQNWMDSLESGRVGLIVFR